jgi:hypothetical protein
MFKRRYVYTLLFTAIAIALSFSSSNVKSRAYVNTIYVSTTGSDTPGNGSINTPFQTPGYALSAANPGDTIYFRAGTYTINSTLFVDKAGITFATNPGDQQATITCLTSVPYIFRIYEADNVSILNLKLSALYENTSTETVVWIWESDNFTIADSEIKGGRFYGIKPDAYDGDCPPDGCNTSGTNCTPPQHTTGMKIQRCKIYDTGRDAIKSFNADNLLIEGCEIYHSGMRALEMGEIANAEGMDIIGSKIVYIRDCYVHDTLTNGIYLKGSCRDGVVERCRVSNIGSLGNIPNAPNAGGILLGQSTSLQFMRECSPYEAINCTARNNLIINTGAAGLGSYAGNGVKFFNNTLYNVAQNMQAAFWIVENERDVFSRDVTFENNIVTTNSNRTRNMMYIKNIQTPLVSDYNLFYNTNTGNGTYEFCQENSNQVETCYSSLSAWKSGSGVDIHSLSANPQLDSNALYKPLSNSPAINAGLALTSLVTDDYSKIARPQGGAYEIGAHEIPAGVTCNTATAGTNPTWVNQSFASQSGSFTAEFDVTPLGQGIDTLVALSNGAQTAWTGLACIVRFNPGNTIDVRNGGSYQSTNPIGYTQNVKYHIRMVISLSNHIYSVYVTPFGENETLLAQNYAFRTEQNSVLSLNNLALVAEIGALEVCNFTPQITCPSTLSPANNAFAANGGTGSFQVQMPTGCSWTATANDSWITITSGSGNGNGTVSYSVAAHSNSSNRTGSISAAGQTFTVLQGIAFLDVPVSDPAYTEIGKLSARGVTLGCGSGNYCPESFVTREQMSAFLIRARGEFNPPTPSSQRFLDVPPNHPFYAFIDRLAVLQITLGCGGGNYCPSSTVAREQMAAFLIRSLHEPGYVPPTPASQRFTDVPPNHPFYAYIEEMAVRGITLGCGTNIYCPSSNLTRREMAVFLVRAFNL